jgi:hypothetical protein
MKLLEITVISLRLAAVTTAREQESLISWIVILLNFEYGQIPSAQQENAYYKKL